MEDVPRTAEAVGGTLLVGIVALAGAGLGCVRLALTLKGKEAKNNYFFQNIKLD